MNQFYCQKHKQWKAIPLPKYQVGDCVNYTLRGHGGHPATNQKGHVQLMVGKLLTVATEHGKLIKLYNDLESVTPDWAPHPKNYLNPGKCFCEIRAEVQQDGAV